MPFDGLRGRVSYAAHYWLTFWTLTLGWGYRRGGRPLPPSGPLLVAANHQSFIDPLLVAMAAGRPLTFLARKNLFNDGPFARLIAKYGAVPIDRGFGKDGIERVLAELARGAAVLVFPEGERTHSGRVQELKPGIALLAKRAGVPVVPVGVAGAYDAWPRHRALPTAAPLVLPSNGKSIAVHVGDAIPPERLAPLDRAGVLEVLQRELERTHATAERNRRRSSHRSHG